MYKFQLRFHDTETREEHGQISWMCWMEDSIQDPPLYATPCPPEIRNLVRALCDFSSDGHPEYGTAIVSTKERADLLMSWCKLNPYWHQSHLKVSVVDSYNPKQRRRRHSPR